MIILLIDPEDAVTSEQESGSQIDQPDEEEEDMQHSSCNRPSEPEDGCSQVTLQDQDKKHSTGSCSGMYIIHVNEAHTSTLVYIVFYCRGAV